MQKQHPKELFWTSGAKDELLALPRTLVRNFGYALGAIQLGRRPTTLIKALQGLGSGLFELRDSDAAGTYRVIYYTSLGDVIYVLHCFQKKSTSGSKIPQKTSALIRARLKEARLHYGYYIDKAP